ncbi:hypothetical protein ROJ8625_02902 [Roseivivax jejudonensis]|uniref:DUF302 domain-containing protein n=1 Tax=Roseivivax jejudonensis TaxID=1529041 RepID=A0A1X6ZPW6_9RHOB|nr:DUF302 domain-containing protein [Roseivivax jejudonensis]SLN57875.1 hypothetical protein ROJ8625_02902 [Roseivivax jejudonensis]
MIRGIAVAASLAALPAAAQEVADLSPRDGWSITATEKAYDMLVADTRAAITEGGLGIVTQAGPTGAAAARGVTIPGNTVIGAFNNAYAVDILRVSTAAMIEAPIRFYVTENADGTATLSYKRPSMVFAPYMAEAPELEPITADLDDLFATIAAAATE